MIAVAVPPWVHRKAVRDFGPADKIQRLVALTINTYMADDGTAWPAQRTIAKASLITEKTAQRAVRSLINGSWLATTIHLNSTRAWKLYRYHCAVPEQVARRMFEVDPNCAAVVQSYIEKYGSLAQRGASWGPLPAKGSKSSAGPEISRGTFAECSTHDDVLPPGDDHEVPPQEFDAPPSREHEVPPPEGDKVPSEASIEVSNLKQEKISRARNSEKIEEGSAPEGILPPRKLTMSPEEARALFQDCGLDLNASLTTIKSRLRLDSLKAMAVRDAARAAA